ncbi:hypothetical protein IE53DRAFT_330732 [Violaceomyces palustris]|uniref:Uncharacterized protein n=1 Tax=Violaceomyces palustris TaxID=1673888 RepID=A0ACD0NWH5_9BASI|nr:hypothetical protein IE53DRAFT_330732 [Violaceomyces palustris]
MPPSSSQSQAGASAAAAAAAENYSSFPAIKTEELVGVLSEMGLVVSPEDITRPTSTIAYRIFVAFLECLSGTSQELLERTRHATLAQMEYRELYDDGLQFIMLFREIRAMMVAATITDFHLQDLTRPVPKRFKRQMSALVNFYRFRSDRIAEFEELTAEAEDLENKRNETEDMIEVKKVELERFKRQRILEEPEAKALKAENDKLAEHLLELKKKQGQFMNEHEAYKLEKENLIKKQTDLHYYIQSVQAELRNLQARIVSSPKKLRGSIEAMSEQVIQDRASLADIERKARELNDKLDVVTALESDIGSAIIAMEQVSNEIAKTNAEQKEADEVRSMINHNKHEVQTLSHLKEQTARKMKLANERLERARKNLDDQREINKVKMEDFEKRLEDVMNMKRERNAKIDVICAEHNELERELQTTVKEYEAQRAKMFQDRDHLCHLANVYMDTLSRFLSLDEFQPQKHVTA